MAFRNKVLLLVLVTLATCCALPLMGPSVESDADIRLLLERVDEDRLRQHVQVLTEIGPRPLGKPEASSRTVSYLEEQLLSYGYEVQRKVAIGPLNDYSYAPNLIAIKPGGAQAQQVIALGAHYDTVFDSPGADDNASGVAGVLEAARLLKDVPLEKTVHFCFFTMEEVGLIGSRTYVQEVGLKEEHEGLLNLEMIGFTSTEEGSQDTPVRIPFLLDLPRTGDFVAVVGDFSSGWLGNLFESCAEQYVPELSVYSANRIGGFFPDAARSDHYRFWDAGLDGVMITDTADFRNGHYHQPTDTLKTLDFPFMRRITQTTIATMAHWAVF